MLVAGRSNNALTAKRNSARMDGDVLQAMEVDDYEAVVNPTGEVIQSWGYGRRAVFMPGELNLKDRACVQLWRKKIARKLAWNKRKFLEIMTAEQGRALMIRAKEVGNFWQAYAEATGRSEKRASEVVREGKTRLALHRQLITMGFDEHFIRNWDERRMRDVIADPTRAFDFPGFSVQRASVSVTPAIQPTQAPPENHEPLPEPDTLEALRARVDASADAKRAYVTGKLKELGIRYHGRMSLSHLEELLNKALSSPTSVAVGG